ncbi:hypothetical protein HanIR_Chr10g0498601 [Helianthus annuus]|nr:hypothetical protein HanIR_Chr10g0498601 [Helianthus annuus]
MWSRHFTFRKTNCTTYISRSSVDLQPSSQAAATHCPSFNAVKSLFIHPYHRLQIKLIYHFWKLFWASLLVAVFLVRLHGLLLAKTIPSLCMLLIFRLIKCYL